MASAASSAAASASSAASGVAVDEPPLQAPRPTQVAAEPTAIPRARTTRTRSPYLACAAPGSQEPALRVPTPSLRYVSASRGLPLLLLTMTFNFDSVGVR